MLKHFIYQDYYYGLDYINFWKPLEAKLLMETLNLLYSFVMSEIQKAPFASTIAFLAFLVSLLSAFNSSRAIRLSKRRENESNLLISAEKKTSLLTILQDAQLAAINTKKALTLTDFVINKMANYLGPSPNEKLIEKVTETKNTLSSRQEKLETIEQRIKDKYVEVENMNETNKPYIFEKLSPRVKALQNEAQARLERALALHTEINGYHDLFLKELLTLKRNQR